MSGLFMLFLLALIAMHQVVNAANLRTETIDCKTFNPKVIKLITFDVFAALMDLTSK